MNLEELKQWTTDRLDYEDNEIGKEHSEYRGHYYAGVLALLAKLEASQRLREFTATLTRSHYYCEDGWYSCPQEEEGCANESRGPECDCGADEYNADLSKALAAFDKEQHET